nr:MAG TPA: hypothetical protein [Caudoviricetes sp.]
MLKLFVLFTNYFRSIFKIILVYIVVSVLASV